MTNKTVTKRQLYNWAMLKASSESNRGTRIDEELAGALYEFLLHYRSEFTAKTLAQRTESVIEMIEMLKTQQV